MEMYLQRMKKGWLTLLDQTEPHIRQQVATAMNDTFDA
mgnify:CR=1 FL=1